MIPDIKNGNMTNGMPSLSSGGIADFASKVNSMCSSVFNVPLHSLNKNSNHVGNNTSNDISSYLGANFSGNRSNQPNYNETYQSGQYMSPESMQSIAKNIANGRVNSIANPKQFNLSKEQANNAEIIARVVVEECNKAGKNPAETARAVQIALATAKQESGLENLNRGDYNSKGQMTDSRGLFQQRPSCGWGTFAQVQDPVYAARKFAQALLSTNYMNKSLTQAAQSVQKSGLPDAYARHENKAADLVQALLV